MYEKKVALITGSTHGIGKAIALELARNGYAIVINGASTKELSEEYLQELKEIFDGDLEGSFVYIRADLSKKEDREKIVQKTRNKFGRIDVLVNNAGVGPSERNDILGMTEKSYDRVMDINLKGPFFLTQSIASWMIQLKKELKNDYQGYIINISSISSYTVSLNRGEYCISKAGMSMMTKLFALRLADDEIFVFEISPGIIDTPMTQGVHEKYDNLIKNGLTPIKRWGKPIDIAKTVIAIVSGQIPYSTGQVINIDGGFGIHQL